jgi:hypothetical protein
MSNVPLLFCNFQQPVYSKLNLNYLAQQSPAAHHQQHGQQNLGGVKYANYGLLPQQPVAYPAINKVRAIYWTFRNYVMQFGTSF